MKVLVTCPPMLGLIAEFNDDFVENGWEVASPSIEQTLTEDELISLVPTYDGWIIGDDPATRNVFNAGRLGSLKAAVKWGIGTDNVDFSACKDYGIGITNTPGMFGAEVADLAFGYIAALARQTFLIDRQVRDGLWPKPAGISLSGKTVAIVGLGDIGRNLVRRVKAADMQVLGYDPGVSADQVPDGVILETWPTGIERADFLVLTCALTETSYHMVNAPLFSRVKPGLRIVNVSRGPIIDEASLIDALSSGRVHSAALDVFEIEPLSSHSLLRNFERCIFGSHNASNTIEAVIKTSRVAINKLHKMLTN